MTDHHQPVLNVLMVEDYPQYYEGLALSFSCKFYLVMRRMRRRRFRCPESHSSGG